MDGPSAASEMSIPKWQNCPQGRARSPKRKNSSIARSRFIDKGEELFPEYASFYQFTAQALVNYGELLFRRGSEIPGDRKI